MEELEIQVRRAVAKERGVALERVTLRSTLARDLGMDGDDAIDFFRRFETEFGVDLRALWAEWPKHFGPEAWGPAGFLLVGIPFLCAGILLLLVSRLMQLRLTGWQEFAAFAAVGMFLWFAWARVKYWPAPRFVLALQPRTEITVSDLVAAALRGAWPG